MKALISAFAIAVISSAAAAECPARPPWEPTNWQPGDQRISAAWMHANLDGRRVVWPDPQYGGTEHFRQDGSYRYQGRNQSWNAPGYRFYDGGARCIAYDRPRFDYYVVNDGELIGILQDGTRATLSIRR